MTDKSRIKCCYILDTTLCSCYVFDDSVGAFCTRAFCPSGPFRGRGCNKNVFELVLGDSCEISFNFQSGKRFNLTSALSILTTLFSLPLQIKDNYGLTRVRPRATCKDLVEGANSQGMGRCNFQSSDDYDAATHKFFEYIKWICPTAVPIQRTNRNVAACELGESKTSCSNRYCLFELGF